jgi:hypothetical protein
LIIRLELASALVRADLILFSAAFSEVWNPLIVGMPPVERRAVDLFAVVFFDDAERPLALRLVLLRAVVLRAPPVLPAVLRLAVLRAAGDIELLSLGGRWRCLFHTPDASARCIFT